MGLLTIRFRPLVRSSLLGRVRTEVLGTWSTWLASVADSTLGVEKKGRPIDVSITNATVFGGNQENQALHTAQPTKGTL